MKRWLIPIIIAIAAIGVISGIAYSKVASPASEYGQQIVELEQQTESLTQQMNKLLAMVSILNEINTLQKEQIRDIIDSSSLQSATGYLIDVITRQDVLLKQQQVSTLMQQLEQLENNEN